MIDKGNNTILELKNKYKYLNQIVKKSIDQWDPINLLPFCPADEYDFESKRITAIILKDITEDDLAKEIESVFIEAFSSGVFTKDIADCQKIAKIIKQKLNNMKSYNK